MDGQFVVGQNVLNIVVALIVAVLGDLEYIIVPFLNFIANPI